MPIPMIEEFNTRTTREKVIYIYSCLNGEPVREWLEIYRALAEFGVLQVNTGMKV